MSIKMIATGAMTAVMAVGLMCGNVFADVDGIEINDENFPDPVFSNYVAQEFDDGDGVLSEDELSAVKKIELPRRVTDITGIEYFKNLTYFDSGYSKLGKIDLGKNTALKKLYLMYSELTEINISENKALEVLVCSNNDLTKLDVSKNTKLKELDCAGNKLAKLDVSKNTKLKKLDCSYNKLSTLNVSKNTVLKELNCNNNKLTKLNLSKNIKLTALDCGSNSIKSLDLSKNKKLLSLTCSSNVIQSINIKNCHRLWECYIVGKKLTKLDISNCPRFMIVYLANNKKPFSKRDGVAWYWRQGQGDLNSFSVSTKTKLITSKCTLSGWVYMGYGDYVYYSSHKLVKGWKKINKKWYYFGSDGFMLANTSKKIGKKTYKFDKNGVCKNP